MSLERLLVNTNIMDFSYLKLSICNFYFMTVFSLLADVAVLFLTVYTFYLTAISKRVEFISPTFGGSTFEGNRMSLTFMNKTLHAVPVTRVFLLRENDEGRFQYLSVVDYDPPVAMDSWRLMKVETKPYADICDLNGDKPQMLRADDVFKKSVICIEAGRQYIWIKSYKNAPLRKAKRAYQNHDFDILTMQHRIYDGVYVSQAVDRMITIRMKDMNGQLFLKRSFAITGFDGGKAVLLNEPIMGYMALSFPGNSVEEIAEEIHRDLGIPMEDIGVQMLDDLNYYSDDER